MTLKFILKDSPPDADAEYVVEASDSIGLPGLGDVVSYELRGGVVHRQISHRQFLYRKGQLSAMAYTVLPPALPVQGTPSASR